MRDADLNLLDEVKFSSFTLVQNFNAPGTLQISGRLEFIRQLLQPGYGVVLRGDDGTTFSGRLTSAQRKGDGTGVAIYNSDLVTLWDRVCYPNTNLAWDSQISNRDIVTGTAEDRILSLIDRNAGPSAWHSGITGTDPGDSTVFTSWKVLFPDDRKKRIEVAAVDPVNGDLYMVQTNGGTANTLIQRVDTNGILKGTMTLVRGGSPEVMYVSSSGTGAKRKVFLTFRHGASDAPTDHGNTGTWVRLEWTNNKTWKATQAQPYKTRTPAGSTRGRGDWFQGEATYAGYTFRLYGSPFTNSGGDVAAYVEVLKGNKVQKTVPAGHLARDAANNPYDGRLEPAGLSVVTVSGQPCLAVGFCTGTTNGGDGGNGLIAQRIYTLPLKPAPRAAEDRRVAGLRLPTTQARGASGTSTVRYDILGPLVASLAEAADLSVDIRQSYDGRTPYLALTLSSTPDMSDSIRVGNLWAAGPVALGDDWSYTAAIPTFTTGLAAAGEEGSDRILKYQTSGPLEDLWNVRVESFLDQRGTTDLSELDDTITKAISDASGTSSITVPLGHSTIRWGVDVPLGAKIAAVLDGQSVVDRIRQITTTVSNSTSDATTTTTAVLGSPDAALKTPTQKQLAQMLRRIQKLERN